MSFLAKHSARALYATAKRSCMFVTDSERGRGDGEIEVEDGGTDAAGDVAELRDDIDSWLSTRDSACTVSVGFVKFRGT